MSVFRPTRFRPEKTVCGHLVLGKNNQCHILHFINDLLIGRALWHTMETIINISEGFAARRWASHPKRTLFRYGNLLWRAIYPTRWYDPLKLTQKVQFSSVKYQKTHQTSRILMLLLLIFFHTHDTDPHSWLWIVTLGVDLELIFLLFYSWRCGGKINQKGPNLKILESIQSI